MDTGLGDLRVGNAVRRRRDPRRMIVRIVLQQTGVAVCEYLEGDDVGECAAVRLGDLVKVEHVH